jgi:hypothetical protein
MAIVSAPRTYRTFIAAGSLVVGPFLMAVGDLQHPEESMVPAEQIAIVADHASHWFTAHLLLFVGILLFIPGFLTGTALTAARNPVAGYLARILMMVGTAAFAAILVGEMLIGRLLLNGASQAAATDVLATMFSGPMMAAVGPALLAFFVGTSAFAIPLMRGGGTLAWAAALILIGVLFIFAEIVSAKVILSQIGNVLAFCGSAIAAWVIVRSASSEIAESA